MGNDTDIDSNLVFIFCPRQSRNYMVNKLIHIIPADKDILWKSAVILEKIAVDEEEVEQQLYWQKCLCVHTCLGYIWVFDIVV